MGIFRFRYGGPFNAEGPFYLLRVFKSSGETEWAREMFEQAIESAHTSPDYRR